MKKKATSNTDFEAHTEKDEQTVIDAKVRQMLDPEIKDTPSPPEEPDSETADDEAEALPEREDIIDEIAGGQQQTDSMSDKQSDTRHSGSRWKRFIDGLRAWWHDPKKRNLTLVGTAFALIVALTVPVTRYFVLNTVGIRSKASIVILDDSTQQPLKNVLVELGGRTTQTDKDGRAEFSKLRLGKQTLTAEKRAFAELSKTLVIGWGSNPLGEVKISPTGTQYNFEITDYLSGLPLEKVEAVTGDFNAQSDEKGLLRLALEGEEDTQTLEVAVSAEGYRQELITLNLDSKEPVRLALVPSQQHVFVSKRSGRYDIYKIDADGKNETRILSGSGSERDDLVLVPHSTNGYVALVSTRENVRNKSGFLLSTLTLIEPGQNIPSKIAQSERIQIIDWIKDRLVYVQIIEGSSAADPRRHRLMSYDLSSGKSTEIAAANYFNDVISINGSIFYAPSATYSTESPGFYKISPDGKNKATVHGEEVWNVFRTDYDKLVMASGSSWFDFVISTAKLTRLSGEPPNLTSRIYVPSPSGEQNLWVDERDGKGVLLALHPADKQEKVLLERSGLQNPVRWLNDSAVVFRVVTSQETADYVMSLNGGEPRKLKDVTDTAGIDRWYYY